MKSARLGLRVLSRVWAGVLLSMVVGCAAADEPAVDDDADDDQLGAPIDPAKIELASGEIDTAGAKPLDVLPEGERVIVRFPAPPTAGQLEELENATDAIYAYLPDHAFLVKPAAGRRTSLAELGATWSGRMAGDQKVGRSARNFQGSEPQIVMVQVFPDGDLARVGTDAGVGGRVVGRQMGARFGRVRLIVPAEEVVATTRALAANPDVYFVDLEARRIFLNDTTDWVVQSGLDGGQSTPVWNHGILGEGQIVGILDSGVDMDMCYFKDPARGLPPQNLCNFGTAVDNAQRKVIAVDFTWDEECAGGISTREWDTHGHGTHVAGTVAGDNFANPLGHDTGDGVAPGAKLVIQDCGGPEIDDCADCSGIGCPVVDLKPFFKQAFDQGARIHTNSWGDQENSSVQNNYTAACEDSDQFMWDHKDFLIVYAGGNDGPGTETVGSPSTAKSVLSVGATRRGTGADSMATFSSCGPTDDGRIKPEITMPGQSIISASSDFNIGTNNCGRESMSGTSMAAPGAAGAAALVRQYFADGYYPSGAAVTADKRTPSAALVRAILVSSARNMPGATAMPSNCQGWGRVTLDDALYFGGDGKKLTVRDDASFSGGAGDSRVFTYAVAAGQPLKVTLAWTDFPSTPAASTHLVNDLDLEVTGPGGTWRGNAFSGGVSTTGGSADRRNTLEQVLLASPSAGTYTVTVRGFTVPRGPQPFALVVTGNVTAADAGALHANAGPDASGAVAKVVNLDGRGSSAPDGATLGYIWTQTGGPDVTITGDRQVTAAFTPVQPGSYTFSLTVENGASSDTDSVTITVTGSAATVVFADDFESDKGWTFDPAGSDTATAGPWERGNPSNTSYQIGRTVSGFQDLSTGHLAKGSASANDLDGGKTSVQSAAISVPAGASLSFSYYLAHSDNSTTVDYLRVKVVGSTTTTVLELRGAAAKRPPVWARTAVSLAAFSGQSVRILIEANDSGKASLVEAAVDDVMIVR